MGNFIAPAKHFYNNYNLQKQYGTYENYKNAMSGSTEKNTSDSNEKNTSDSNNFTINPSEDSLNYYTFDDIFKVEDKSDKVENDSINNIEKTWDVYKDEYKKIYEQGVDANNKTAISQAANAGAQYREVERNVNEINKANGKVGTGYAGDTSIDAYNAYRNSVNTSYSNAQENNNSLFSYYLNSLMDLEKIKQEHIADERSFKLTQETIENEKSSGVLDWISTKKDENPDITYLASGNINPSIAKSIMNYLINMYGSSENIPTTVKAELEDEKGFAQSLTVYDNLHNNKDVQELIKLSKKLIGANISDVLEIKDKINELSKKLDGTLSREELEYLTFLLGS